MKRYDPYWPDNNYGGDMFEEPDGEWVRYEEVQAEIGKLEEYNIDQGDALDKLRQRVAELEARLKTAETAAQILGNDVFNLTEKVLPPVRKDAERLEFVIKNFIRAGSVDMSGKHAWTGIGRLIGYGNNPREAIDAAMEKGEPL